MSRQDNTAQLTLRALTRPKQEAHVPPGADHQVPVHAAKGPGLLPALTGKRVLLSTPEGCGYDMRAADEIRTDGQGKALMPIITERQHFERPSERALPGILLTSVAATSPSCEADVAMP